VVDIWGFLLLNPYWLLHVLGKTPNISHATTTGLESAGEKQLNPTVPELIENLHIPKEFRPMTITKAHLRDSIRARLDLSNSHATPLIESLLKIIKATLQEGEDVLISGFGKFCVRDKKERRGRHPVSGGDLMLDLRRVVTFRCSPVLRDKLNGRK